MKRNSTSPRVPAALTRDEDASWRGPAAAIAFASVALLTAGLFTRSLRWWGIGSITAVPPWVAALTLGGLAALGAATLWTRLRLDDVLRPNAVFLGLSFALIGMVLFAPIQVALYGDGPILVPQVYRLAMTGNFRADILLNAKSSPLAGLALLAAARITPVLSGAAASSMLYPFRTVSLVALVIALLLVWRHRPAAERTATLLALFGSAGAVFFFGYPEMYTALFVALLFYAFAAERHLRGEGGLFPPLLAFLIAASAHFMTLALLPTLVMLFLHRRGSTSRWHARMFGNYRSIPLAVLAVLALWLPVYYLTGLHAAGGRIIMPAVAITTEAGTQAYTLWSDAHVADLLNVLLLAAPASLVALVAGLIDRRGEPADPVLYFHLAAIACMGVFLLFANTSLGLARDWDITAPLGLFIVLAAIATLRRDTTRGRRLSLLAAVSLLSALPWLWVHIDERSALARFEDVMELDARNVYGDYALSGYEGLRKQYLHERDARKESETLKRMLGILQYPEHVRLLIRSSSEVGQTDPAYYAHTQDWLLRVLGLRCVALRANGRTRSYDLTLVQIDSLAADIAYQAVGLGREKDIRSALIDFKALTDPRLPPALVAGIAAMYRREYNASADAQYVINRGYITPRHYGLLVRRCIAEGRPADADAIAAEAGDRALRAPDYCYLVASAYVDAGIRLNQARDLINNALSHGPDDALRQRLEALKVRAAGMR
jgi:hypothetical protein